MQAPVAKKGWVLVANRSKKGWMNLVRSLGWGPFSTCQQGLRARISRRSRGGVLWPGGAFPVRLHRIPAGFPARNCWASPGNRRYPWESPCATAPWRCPRFPRRCIPHTGKPPPLAAPWQIPPRAWAAPRRRWEMTRPTASPADGDSHPGSIKFTAASPAAPLSAGPPIWNCLCRKNNQPVEKPPGVRGPQPPEALIGFGDMRVKSAKSLA